MTKKLKSNQKTTIDEKLYFRYAFERVKHAKKKKNTTDRTPILFNTFFEGQMSATKTVHTP